MCFQHGRLRCLGSRSRDGNGLRRSCAGLRARPRTPGRRGGCWRSRWCRGGGQEARGADLRAGPPDPAVRRIREPSGGRFPRRTGAAHQCRGLGRAGEPVAFAGSLFGAVCPARGTAAGLVLPFANTAAMNAHLAGIARSVAPVRRENDPPDRFLTRPTPCAARPRRGRLARTPSSCPTISPCRPTAPSLASLKTVPGLFSERSSPVEKVWAFLRQLARHPHLRKL